KRPANAGRQKGTPNKVTATAKQVIEQVAMDLGGAAGMLRWAKRSQVNQRLFWGSIFPKLLPLQVRGPGLDGRLVLELKHERLTPEQLTKQLEERGLPLSVFGIDKPQLGLNGGANDNRH